MLRESPVDVYRIAEHANRCVCSDCQTPTKHARCLNLLHEHPRRNELLTVLIDAGESAWARGAHEVSLLGLASGDADIPSYLKLAFRSLSSARTLLRGDPWKDRPSLTFLLYSRLAA